ncbi:MAG: hypothetical protein NWQ54_13630 [Paraglaciecola sp.]|uniref:hypothetical protein n=1 Tax=Paraglaciecola sp. TaxID=1920173 RepID=UPI00273F1AEC|nr:hypothetical protein [Paraglaciecola sp.]MDP5032036.1 hypothetical protein [Paraglaciecola sp.]MDP5039727.1 hypothetical protein [Paraglaciecola sp.]MDP5131922.1 hypothetical protein [Paraglaciecola sp.]
MTRFFIISFEILALVALLRSPFMHYWFDDVQSKVADWMLDISLMAERNELSIFRQAIISHTNNLTESQLAYLETITANKMSVSHFDSLYCQANDKNPYFYGANLRYLCSEIASSQIVAN